MFDWILESAGWGVLKEGSPHIRQRSPIFDPEYTDDYDAQNAPQGATQLGIALDYGGERMDLDERLTGLLFMMIVLFGTFHLAQVGKVSFATAATVLGAGGFFWGFVVGKGIIKALGLMVFGCLVACLFKVVGQFLPYRAAFVALTAPVLFYVLLIEVPKIFLFYGELCARRERVMVMRSENMRQLWRCYRPSPLGLTLLLGTVLIGPMISPFKTALLLFFVCVMVLIKQRIDFRVRHGRRGPRTKVLVDIAEKMLGEFVAYAKRRAAARPGTWMGVHLGTARENDRKISIILMLTGMFLWVGLSGGVMWDAPWWKQKFHTLLGSELDRPGGERWLSVVAPGIDWSALAFPADVEEPVDFLKRLKSGALSREESWVEFDKFGVPEKILERRAETLGKSLNQSPFLSHYLLWRGLIRHGEMTLFIWALVQMIIVVVMGTATVLYTLFEPALRMLWFTYDELQEAAPPEQGPQGPGGHDEYDVHVSIDPLS